MPTNVLRPDQVFAFRHLARALDGFAVPGEPFSAAGAWTATYELMERSARQVRHGALRLQRVPEAGGRFRLHLTLRKQSGGGTLRARGEILCQADVLSSPLSWSLESEAIDRQGKRVAETFLTETGAIERGQMRVRRGGGERVTPLAGAVTMDWCLFDAVQRLPRGTGPALRFGLLDRLGSSVKDGHVLTVGSSQTLALGGRRVWSEAPEPLEAGTRYRPVEVLEGTTDVTLQSYEHVGQGILPTTYWVDGRGQLLFVLAGLSAWILNPKGQV